MIDINTTISLGVVEPKTAFNNPPGAFATIPFINIYLNANLDTNIPINLGLKSLVNQRAIKLNFIDPVANSSAGSSNTKSVQQYWG